MQISSLVFLYDDLAVVGQERNASINFERFKMEDVPPSYQSAIDREAWNVIAPWITSGDLCSACLVSRKWHSIFVPFLWGDPARHFGIENDAVFQALTRFKRTLRKARPSVRALTHTLHLPPALSEIYGGPNREWLRDVLEYLPNLQSLIVNRLPFFDHQSCLALRTPSNRRKSFDGDDSEVPVYGLKLLLAAHEPNATASSIASALPCFQALVYLDLSYTTPVKDAAVLASLSNLYDLQVLKLQGIGLRDGEAEVLANSIGIKVRLLDLSNNLLSDMAVRSLMQACFMPSKGGNTDSRTTERQVEDWPVGIRPGPELFSLDTLRSEDLDRELLKQLTNPLTGRLAFEDIPHRGLTHLYIAGNRISVEGVSSLLQSERLHLLDVGAVENVKTIVRTKSLSSNTGYRDEVRYPGAEKLVPVLAKFAAPNLTHLRIDHAVVTEKHEFPEEFFPKPKPAIELHGTIPLASELPPEERQFVEAPAPAHYAVELPTSNDPIYEMDATPAQPRYELVGDIMQFAISPPIGDKPESSTPALAEVLSPIRGEGAYAPEVVPKDEPEADDSYSEGDDVVLNASGSGLASKPTMKQKTNGVNGTDVSAVIQNGTLKSPGPVPESPVNVKQMERPANKVQHRTTASMTHRSAQIAALLKKRPRSALLPSHDLPGSKDFESASYLHPSQLPNLRTFILTDVPTSVPRSSPILAALKSFISACADESALAHLRAQTNYSLPPGRARHAAELDHARSLFALRTIILEMAPPGVGNKSRGQMLAERGWHSNKIRATMLKSSTGDHDSENLWSAAENDFSFFGEEGEEHDECGIYDNEPDKYFPTAHLDDKIVYTPMEGSEDAISGRRSSGHSPHDSTSSLHRQLPQHQYAQQSANTYRSPTVLRSPRDLPLGRNRRGSSGSADFDRDRGSLRERILSVSASNRPPNEMPGSVPSTPVIASTLQSRHPTSRPANFPPPTSHPNLKSPPQTPSSPYANHNINNNPVEPPTEPQVDLVAELAAWRRARRQEYTDAVIRWKLARPAVLHRSSGANAAKRATESDDMFDERDMPVVAGHWKGEVQVVKNPHARARLGVVDVYGNYFEKGYLYP